MVDSASRGGRSSVGRAPGCGPGGRGFESHRSPSRKSCYQAVSRRSFAPAPSQRPSIVHQFVFGRAGSVRGSRRGPARGRRKEVSSDLCGGRWAPAGARGAMRFVAAEPLAGGGPSPETAWCWRLRGRADPGLERPTGESAGSDRVARAEYGRPAPGPRPSRSSRRAGQRASSAVRSRIHGTVRSRDAFTNPRYARPPPDFPLLVEASRSTAIYAARTSATSSTASGNMGRNGRAPTSAGGEDPVTVATRRRACGGRASAAMVRPPWTMFGSLLVVAPAVQRENDVNYARRQQYRRLSKAGAGGGDRRRRGVLGGRSFSSGSGCPIAWLLRVPRWRSDSASTRGALAFIGSPEWGRRSAPRTQVQRALAASAGGRGWRLRHSVAVAGAVRHRLGGGRPERRCGRDRDKDQNLRRAPSRASARSNGLAVTTPAKVGPQRGSGRHLRCSRGASNESSATFSSCRSTG